VPSASFASASDLALSSSASLSSLPHPSAAHVLLAHYAVPLIRPRGAGFVPSNGMPAFGIGAGGQHTHSQSGLGIGMGMGGNLANGAAPSIGRRHTLVPSLSRAGLLRQSSSMHASMGGGNSQTSSRRALHPALPAAGPALGASVAHASSSSSSIAPHPPSHPAPATSSSTSVSLANATFSPRKSIGSGRAHQLQNQTQHRSSPPPVSAAVAQKQATAQLHGLTAAVALDPDAAAFLLASNHAFGAAGPGAVGAASGFDSSRRGEAVASQLGRGGTGTGNAGLGSASRSVPGLGSGSASASTSVPAPASGPARALAVMSGAVRALQGLGRHLPIANPHALGARHGDGGSTSAALGAATAANDASLGWATPSAAAVAHRSAAAASMSTPAASDALASKRANVAAVLSRFGGGGGGGRSQSGSDGDSSSSGGFGGLSVGALQTPFATVGGSAMARPLSALASPGHAGAGVGGVGRLGGIGLVEPASGSLTSRPSKHASARLSSSSHPSALPLGAVPLQRGGGGGESALPRAAALALPGSMLKLAAAPASSRTSLSFAAPSANHSAAGGMTAPSSSAPSPATGTPQLVLGAFGSPRQSNGFRATHSLAPAAGGGSASDRD
jgi:hypothetical protein